MLLRADEHLSDDLREGFIAPLVAADAERDHQLLETLEAYLATAKRLFVHRHTLATRLKRIDSLTGLDLHDRRHILLIELALEAHRRWSRVAPAERVVSA